MQHLTSTMYTADTGYPWSFSIMYRKKSIEIENFYTSFYYKSKNSVMYSSFSTWTFRNKLFWEQQKLEGIEINGILSYRVKNTVQAEVLNWCPVSKFNPYGQWPIYKGSLMHQDKLISSVFWWYYSMLYYFLTCLSWRIWRLQLNFYFGDFNRLVVGIFK